MSEPREYRLKLGTVDVSDDDLRHVARFYTLSCELAPQSLVVKFVREYGINALDILGEPGAESFVDHYLKAVP